MAYADLLEDESARSEFLVVLKPRRRATGFSHDGGSVYSVSFTHGEVVAMEVDGVALTRVTSGTPAAGEFKYDVSTQVLTARSSGSDNLNNVYSVCTYEIHVGTSAAHYYRDPLDSLTRVVYFDGIIADGGSPTLKASCEDTFFGFLPRQTMSLKLINAENFIEQHLYDSSFNRAQIKLYHWLSELESGNVKLILDGYMGEPSYDTKSVSFQLYDRLDVFNEEFREENTSFFSTSDFPSLDPQFIASPIRYVYGVVEGFVPVNIDYVFDGATTSDNRDFVVVGNQNNLGNISTGVPASPASSATRTYLTSARGFRVGDAVHFDRAVGTDEYLEVTAVNYVSNYIDHAALSGGAMTAGDAIKRGFVGNVYIHQGGVLYKAMYGRDYTLQSFAVGTSGFSFSTNLESNLSMPETLSPSDKVFCRVYGRTNDVTIDGAPFGDEDSETGNLTNSVIILFDLLKRLGISESEIDLTAFDALDGTVDEAIGFAIPADSTGAFPSYKELIINILKTSLLRLFIDNDSKWTVAQIGPIASTSKTVDRTEILDGSLNFKQNYTDIASDITVRYGKAEQPEAPNSNGPSYSYATASSDVARYVHKVSKEKEFESLHFRDADASTLATRLSFIFGDRRGELRFSAKNRLLDVLLSDNIEISRPALPGFTFDEDVERTRDHSVIAVDKELGRVIVTLDDQKGISDNSGSW